MFVLGWMRILAAYGIHLPYTVALQAEMLSMLAKYIPGGFWTPAARVVALRRFGVKETPVVLASIMLEAGLSAIAGVGVFVFGLAFVGGADAPLLPLGLFAIVLGVLLWPPVFRTVASWLLRPFGAKDVEPLPSRTAFELLGFYALTWPLGGCRSSSSSGRSAATRRSPRSRISAAPARWARSWPCWRSSPPRGSVCARRPCTDCCSRSCRRASRSARSSSTGSRSPLVEAVLLLVGLLLLRSTPREMAAELDAERKDLVAQGN